MPTNSSNSTARGQFIGRFKKSLFRSAEERFLITVLIIVSVLGLSQCGSSSSNSAPAITAKASFTADGGVDQAYVLGAIPGSKLLLVNSNGQIIGSGIADRLGSLIIRNVQPGSGYSVRYVKGSTVFGTGSFTVLSTSYVPPESFYSSQHMHVGLNYITMRDGVKLAATLRLPPGKKLSDGPFPTVIEYSGYGTAAPDPFLNALKQPPDPLAPDTATVVGALLAPEFGFAAVSLQMRGTGCSGGAYDLFGLNTTDDGYDAVQIVASQPWVKYHKVGLVGISYSGISQLFVAGARPPGLAAIAPMSPTNDLYATGYPGGIFNNGFAWQWFQQRVSDSKPAPGGGQPWATAEIKTGDKVCLANQALHLQVQNFTQLLQVADHRLPSLYDVRTPQIWASHIDVPVFIAGAFQDEETGGQWPEMLTYLKNDPQVYATIINGDHIDSLGPDILSRWLEFLDIFVARTVPVQPAFYSTFAPLVYEQTTNTASYDLPNVRFTNATNYQQAKQDFETQTPRVRVLFDNGGSSSDPGAMGALWEEDFNSWPPASAQVTTYYLGPNGTLTTSKPPVSQVSYNPNPDLRPRTDLSHGSVWAALPPFNWTPLPAGAGIGFITQPLAQNMVVVGPASLNLMLKSTASDTDLQVTVSEVMPDGQEMYVQNGWLRASDRALNNSLSTVTNPVPTYLASTASSLLPGKFVDIRVPILPIGFAFRQGSRLRVTISAPGGDRPEWAFDTFKTGGKVTDTVRLGGSFSSALVLSVIPGKNPPDSQPACPSLRGEPCRTYIPESNGG
jgi:predicted acyl esterase